MFTFGLIGFLLGCAWAAELPAQVIRAWNWSHLAWWWLTMTLAIGLVSWIWQHPIVTRGVILAIFVMMGLAWTVTDRHGLLSLDLPFGQIVTIEGRLRDFPQLVGRSQRFILETSALGREVGLQIQTSREPLQVRDTQVKLQGRLQPPPESKTFNYPRYLEGQGVLAVIDRPELIEEQAPPRSVYRVINRLRDRIITTVTRILPEPTASLALGLTLGIPPTLDEDLREALARTNLTHLAAVSGQNLSLTVMIIFGLIRLIWLRAGIAISLLFLGIYVGLVGGEPSVTRAATLATLIILAPLFGRPVEPLRVLLLTAAAMAAANPLIITRDVGFQLSFAAFAGILLVAPLFKAKLVASLPEWLAELLATVLAASLTVLPIQLIVFEKLSLVGPLANFVVGLIVPFAMGLAFIVALLALVSPVIAYLPALLLYLPLVFLSQVALFLGNWPISEHELVISPVLVATLVVGEIAVFLALRRLLARNRLALSQQKGT